MLLEVDKISSLLTIESVDRVEVDLRIQKGLDSGGDIVGVIVLAVAVTAIAMVVMVSRHGGK